MKPLKKITNTSLDQSEEIMQLRAELSVYKEKEEIWLLEKKIQQTTEAINAAKFRLKQAEEELENLGIPF